MAARVRAVPGVVGLSAGSFGATATPVPGGRIAGVAVRGGEVEVGVVVLLDRPIPDTAADIREAALAAAGASGDRSVHVRIEDVAGDDGEGTPSGEDGDGAP
ncbi:hypothetical protein FZ103_01815 [Streptomonospora sp. PA3]|nr:hypothetical protein [Streptomonospora sp. PA3]